tara:strand:- start:321 stop:1580 length:1260 start_codon:yes stop_codon:yes gene_type:complete
LNKLKFSFLFILLFLISLSILYFYFSSPSNKKQILLANQVRYASLDSWINDDHLKAFNTFKISCKKLINLNPKKNMGAFINDKTTTYPLAGTVMDWLEPCKESFKLKINDNKGAMLYFQKWFLPFSISYSYSNNIFSKGDDLGLFTGYYEPLIEGSTIYTNEYKYPIYSYPENYIKVNLEDFNKSLKGKFIIGKITDNNFTPADTRQEIDKGAIQSKSQVLYWLKDDIDSFFLHIQGSGIIMLPNGKQERVMYNGNNGYDYYAIGTELIKKGYILKENISMQTIKEWLKNNPNKKNDILKLNKRYIFFKKSNSNFAKGSQNTSLIAMRSLAVDLKWIPLGVPLWVDIDNFGDEKKLKIKKLMISQDTGSAIKGIIRGDIFFGTGQEPGLLAGKLKQLGKYYILLPRKLIIKRNKTRNNE